MPGSSSLPSRARSFLRNLLGATEHDGLTLFGLSRQILDSIYGAYERTASPSGARQRSALGCPPSPNLSSSRPTDSLPSFRLSNSLPRSVPPPRHSGRSVLPARPFRPCFESQSGDVPMSRVNFGARQEYEYLNNFKVLQKSFKDHKIDKVRSNLLLHSIVSCGWSKRQGDCS